MIYVNLTVFFLITIAAILTAVTIARRDRSEFYRDFEFYGSVVYACAAFGYFQAALRIIIGLHVATSEQRALNLLFGLSLLWSIMIIALRRGYVDGVFDRIFKIHR